MADVRSLLRQQRAARRIDHPHAAYSEAGKLLCVVCHEAIKAESLWDGHVRGSGHWERVQALQASASATLASNGSTRGQRVEAETSQSQSQSHKRKHSRTEDDDEDMDKDAQEEDLRKKRSKNDMASPAPALPSVDVEHSNATALGVIKGRKEGDKHDTPTPSSLSPPLTRRTSGTPVQGVEMKIPSRPATPNPLRGDGTNSSTSGGQGSAVSTPKIIPVGRSPLIPQEATTTGLGMSSSTLAPKLAAAPTAAEIDEAEWAAFEAEVVNAPPATATGISASAIESATADAVISAAPLTAEEVAARAEEDERAKRRAVADVQMEDEKEEATRALETEFEEMEELEARVRRLKEKREALRQRSGSGPGPVVESGASKGTAGKENVAANGAGEDDEEDADEDEEDDWDGFRFRA